VSPADAAATKPVYAHQGSFDGQLCCPANATAAQLSHFERQLCNNVTYALHAGTAELLQSALAQFPRDRHLSDALLECRAKVLSALAEINTVPSGSSGSPGPTPPPGGGYGT
jgi:hypothetical protein